MTDREKGARSLFDLDDSLKSKLVRRSKERAGELPEPEPTPRAGESGGAEGDAPLRGHPEFEKLGAQFAVLKALGIEDPFYWAHEGVGGAETVINGRPAINFASYDYLGLKVDARVGEAACSAIHAYGTSASASRFVGGERAIHAELEAALVELLGAEASLCFVSGVLANMTTIASVMGPGDLVVHDALIHNSVLQGIRLSGAHRMSFPHNDWDALDQLLTQHRGRFGRALVIVEGLYSMDGDIPDLPQFIEVKMRHRALLMVDEAHSMGVLGVSGRGISEHFGVPTSDVDMWMGTLSKTLAGCGGYTAGRADLVRFLRYRAPGAVFSVGMAPPLAAASLEAIRIMLDEPARVATLRQRSELFLALARQEGLDTGKSVGAAIVPVLVGDTLKTIQLCRTLLDRGVHAPPAIPPGVDPSTSRLRFFVNATHSEAQIREAVSTLGQVAREMGLAPTEPHPG